MTFEWKRNSSGSRSRCGDGVSVVHEMTTLSGGTSNPSSVTNFISCYVESEAQNAHFQPSAWGFLTTKHSLRFANDGALALCEKIVAGMDFRDANRL